MDEKIFVLEGENEGLEFFLSGKIMTLGASKDCDIVLKGLLEKHAILEKKDDNWIIRCLDKNEKINFKNKEIDSLELHYGAKFYLSKIKLVYGTSKAEEDTQHVPKRNYEEEDIFDIESLSEGEPLDFGKTLKKDE